MAMITVVSGKGAPGATTTAAAVAAGWPAPVVLADCDPSGGDVAAGWLGQLLLGGRLRADTGVLSYATASRHDIAGDPASLTSHLQPVPFFGHLRVLAGLSSPEQHSAIGSAGWIRLTQALAAVTTVDGRPADTVVDLGRFSAATPWPLLLVADLVLIAVRPTHRHVLAARPVVAELGPRISPVRLRLALCATTAAGSRDVCAALGQQAGLHLPNDPATAAVFSDGIDNGRLPRRAPLWRSARHAAARLYGTHHQITETEPQPAAPSGAAIPIGAWR